MNNDFNKVFQKSVNFAAHKILKTVENASLPYGYSILIIFSTSHPKVSIPRRLLAKYPSEMTIAIEAEKFSDLKVNDDSFSVSMNFDGVIENISIPFSSIKILTDNDSSFLIQFENTNSNLEFDDEIEVINKKHLSTSLSNLDKPNNIISLTDYKKNLSHHKNLHR